MHAVMKHGMMLCYSLWSHAMCSTGGQQWAVPIMGRKGYMLRVC
jgi:hypothetical protein